MQSAPDAIVATSDPVLAQLHRLTSTLPIIFTQISEPVETGLVASLARPGGNITGFQNFEPAIGGKWLEVLKEMAPNLKRVGALSMPDAKAHASFLDAAKQVAPSVGVAVAVVNIQKDIERAIASYSDQPDSGLIVFPAPKDDCKPQIDQLFGGAPSVAGDLPVSILCGRWRSDHLWPGSDRSMARGCNLR